mmetsp:Transcript_39287/g.123888  ORF Transcript_39287/g.123888 Transcript_39287/m.123888 type:complete len:204 (-) Transcript_39287:118-729(-)
MLQESKLVDLHVVPQAVNFEPLVVVDVDVLLLCRRKQALVVKKADVSDRLLCMHLTHGVAQQQVANCQVPQLPAKQEVTSAPRVVETVGAELFEPEGVDLLRASDVNRLFDVLLLKPVRLLHSFSFEVSCFSRQENLSSRCLGRCFSDVPLGSLDLHLQLLVLNLPDHILVSPRVLGRSRPAIVRLRLFVLIAALTRAIRVAP